MFRDYRKIGGISPATVARWLQVVGLWCAVSVRDAADSFVTNGTPSCRHS